MHGRGELSLNDLVSSSGPSSYTPGAQRIGTEDEARYFRLSQHQRSFNETVTGVIMDRNVLLAEVCLCVTWVPLCVVLP